MENLPQLAPLVILLPAIGAFINIFWGARLGERLSSLIATVAAGGTFVVAVLLFVYLTGSNYLAAVINPPLLSTWISIPSGGVEISWQQRVDTLSVGMMLFVTFVSTLIHIYAAGYMHSDERFARFFAYLNMFLAFMLILVTGNNFLMLFVGWEGVGLCSFLLIGFWWDKKHGVGWRNSLAARKAFIVNRIGDFGFMLAIFLMFWTFGTLDFFRPGELANPEIYAHTADDGAAPVDDGHKVAAVSDDTSQDATPAPDATPAADATHSDSTGAAAPSDDTHSDDAAAADDGHADDGASALQYTDNDHLALNQLGVFGQAERMLKSGAEIHIGPFTLPIETVITLITLCMLLGAAGKSAQIPLFVWLPDAMAGPTPVSAQLHAATMVTAGVYMMVRSNVLFYNAELTSLIVTIVGVSTALVAGFIALGQWDIKRVLAYSTISQLGFMVAAVGIGAYGAAIFHMITHAFFKALLFLGSGSVIHGVEHGHHHAHAHGGGGHGHDDHTAHNTHDATDDDHHDTFDPQDMRNMGGLSKKMPITYWTYLIGTLALAGIFPLAGFWSKDEILADSFLVGLFDGKLSGYIALGGLLLAAGFTAFYMWRQVEMVFHGAPRTEAAEHAPESVRLMTVPLIILAVFTVLMGFVNVPTGAFGLENLFGKHNLTVFLEYSVAKAHAADFNLALALFATAIGVGGIFAARSIYRGTKAVTSDNKDPLEAGATGLAWNIANRRMYWDEVYFRLIENPFNRIAAFLADVVDWRFWHQYFHNTVIRDGFNTVGDVLSKSVDLGLIDGTVLAVGRITRFFSGVLRQIQTGYVRIYAVVFLLGVVAVIILMLLPAVLPR